MRGACLLWGGCGARVRGGTFQHGPPCAQRRFREQQIGNPDQPALAQPGQTAIERSGGGVFTPAASRAAALQ